VSAKNISSRHRYTQVIYYGNSIFKDIKIFYKQKYNPIKFITELKGVTYGAYNDHLQVFEPTSKQKDLLKILKMR
jgi:hypothetical protein